MDYLALPEDDDASGYTSEQEADRAAMPAEQAVADAPKPERQRAEEKVIGFDLECGKREDNPVGLIREVGLGDKQA